MHSVQIVKRNYVSERKTSAKGGKDAKGDKGGKGAKGAPPPATTEEEDPGPPPPLEVGCLICC